MASILAKVSRDSILDKTATEYPKYNFDKHKGY
jgi:ribonuclease HII